jgi:hypothetical protein
MESKVFPEIYDSFRIHLLERSDAIAPLQLTGRLENYLVHEFISHVHKETDGEFLGISNFGNNGEQKYDIAFVRNNHEKKKEIVYALEAKYIMNNHKLREKEDATDDITTTLKNLANQLKSDIKNKHGIYDVCPQKVGDKIYGLVFASCRKSNYGDESKEKFFGRILSVAKKMGFTCYGSNEEEPIFDEGYEDIEVFAVGDKYYLTLRVGLWQLNASYG